MSYAVCNGRPPGFRDVRGRREEGRILSATVSFGIEGGNILPHRITICDDGAVTATGAVSSTPSRLPRNVVQSLLQLAESTGFFGLPEETGCPSTLPDIAIRFIQIEVKSRVHRVSVHGDCIEAFNRLYDALQAAVNLRS